MTLRERLRVEDMAAILKAPTSQARLLGKYGVELLAPCYREYHPELGEISSYSPGFINFCSSMGLSKYWNAFTSKASNTYWS